MTRYARAKGSKGSNAREPEEATPWSQMVQGLKGTEERNVEDLDGDDFEEEELDEVESEQESNESEAEGVQIPKHQEMNENDTDSESESETDDHDENIEINTKQKTYVEEPSLETGKKKKKRQRNKEKCLNCKTKGHMKKDCPDLPEERRKELQELYIMKVERKGKGTGRKKGKKQGLEGKSDAVKSSSEVKRKQFKKGKKEKKIVKDKTGQIVQDDEGLFQGFRVKQEDVPRLKKLQKDLLAKKLPQTEVNEVLKRERRKAEKELARSKKMVCFHCRKPGHLLNECPDAQMEVMDKDVFHSGHCFKCGSEDHTSKDCMSKLKGGDAFRFAVCFICKETGHLAKTCPDNPKGLYPKGGGCRFCGSVEHLKSECPRKIEKDDREEIRLNRVNTKALEVEEDVGPAKKKAKQNKLEKQKKIVTF